MANTLGVYNPIFYAQEALIWLQKALGMASRVHLGFDAERRSFGLGETVNIRRPSTFTVNNAPATAEDLATETVALTLDNWREVKFKLTDKELAFTGERIINDHIRPAAYALADDIDQKLAALWVDIPWHYVLSAPASIAVSDITGPRKTLFDNKVPLGDEAMMHYMLNGAVEEGFLKLSNFTQWQGSGPTGEQAQLRGTLGTRYGVEIFANQNVTSYTSGAITDNVGAIDGAGNPVAKGTTTITVDALSVSVTGALKKGDTLSIAGDAQRYVVTDTSVNTTAGGVATINISPGLSQSTADNAVVTLHVGDKASAPQTATAFNELLMFHRDAFALVTAPLSEIGNELGARIAAVQDPVTGLSLRSRLYYVGNSSEVHVALDVLYGVKTLNQNLAIRAED